MQQQAQALVNSAEAEMNNLRSLFAETGRDADWAGHVMRHTHELLRASLGLMAALDPTDAFAVEARDALADIDAGRA